MVVCVFVIEGKKDKKKNERKKREGDRQRKRQRQRQRQRQAGDQTCRFLQYVCFRAPPGPDN